VLVLVKRGRELSWILGTCWVVDLQWCILCHLVIAPVCLSCLVLLSNKRLATTRQLELDLLARHWPLYFPLFCRRAGDGTNLLLLSVRVRYKHRQDRTA
jgi:hypothetical protein